MKQNVKQNEGFLKRKNIEISAKRYGIDALGAMAQGLFCSLLIGTIIKTLGQQLGLEFLVSVGQYAFDMSGAAMAVAIGYALKADPLVLFSLTGVGYSANALGGAGGPLDLLKGVQGGIEAVDDFGQHPAHTIVQGHLRFDCSHQRTPLFAFSRRSSSASRHRPYKSS